jgi:hypothetical protein
MSTFYAILCILIGDVVFYHLAIAYIGVTVPFRKTILPIVLLSVINYFSRIFFLLPMMINVLIIALSTILIIFFINKVKFILSLIGTLLCCITEAIGTPLLIFPILLWLGIKITGIPNNVEYYYLAYGELVLPIILIIILRVTKISIVKYVN